MSTRRTIKVDVLFDGKRVFREYVEDAIQADNIKELIRQEVDRCRLTSSYAWFVGKVPFAAKHAELGKIVASNMGGASAAHTVLHVMLGSDIAIPHVQSAVDALVARYPTVHFTDKDGRHEQDLVPLFESFMGDYIALYGHRPGSSDVEPEQVREQINDLVSQGVAAVVEGGYEYPSWRTATGDSSRRTPTPASVHRFGPPGTTRREHRGRQKS